jgi:hypothetical protein
MSQTSSDEANERADAHYNWSEEHFNWDRLVSIIALFAVVIAVSVAFNANVKQSEFAKCTRDYLAEDRASRDATTKAGRELQASLANAQRNIPVLMNRIIENARNPEKAQTATEQAKGLLIIQALNEDFTDYLKKFDHYVVAQKENPPPPDPNQFCKDDPTPETSKR